MERIADRNGHGRTAHGGSESAHRIVSACDTCDRSSEKAYAELGTDRVDDRADEKGTEETLGHCAEGVNTVAFRGNFDIFPLEKSFELIHGISSCRQCVRLTKKDWCQDTCIQ